MTEKRNRNNAEDETPPFFKTWKGMYLFVLGFLAFLILAFHLFTDYYR